MKLDYSVTCELINKLPKFQITNWCIISGPPCSGKTTLINALASLGYDTNPDITRRYINKLLSKGLTIEDIRNNEFEFQKRILVLMMRNARALNIKKLIFNDYFLPDNLAFLKIANIDVPSEFEKSSQLFTFRKVFICEPLKLIKDGIRIESLSDQNTLFDYIHSIYKTLGNEIVILPKISVEKRIKIILNEI